MSRWQPNVSLYINTLRDSKQFGAIGAKALRQESMSSYFKLVIFVQN